MKHRKFKSGGIFNGDRLLTDHILVTTPEGIVKDLFPAYGNEADVEELGGTLCPGFINAHCHLELSHMKGRIPRKTGLVDFVYKVITGRQDEKEVLLKAIDAAEKQMIDEGIVAVGDICNNPVSLPQKLRNNLYYHNFIEASGFMPSVVEERFQRSTNLYNAYAQFYPVPAHSISLAPHAPYSVAPELMQRIAAFPGNAILTMHNQETDDENKLFENKTGDFLRLYEKMNIDAGFFTAPGKSSLQAVLPYFYSQQKLILAHNVCTSQEDIDFIKMNDVPALYFCLCPKANLYITGMLPPVDLFIRSGLTIVLGTDSLASNDTLSILAEMNTLKENFPHLEYETMLRWATANGASSLGIEEKFGSFEKGKQPGVLLINKDFTNVRRIL